MQTIGEVAMSSKIKDGFESLSVVGVDIGKDTFHLVGFDDNAVATTVSAAGLGTGRPFLTRSCSAM